AAWMGNSPSGTSAMATTTDVSRTPRSSRSAICRSVPGGAERGVRLRPQRRQVDPRQPRQRPLDLEGVDEDAAAEGAQLADVDAVPGHDERLAVLDRVHDGRAAVAELALADPPHGRSVAQRSHACYGAGYHEGTRPGRPERGVRTPLPGRGVRGPLQWPHHAPGPNDTGDGPPPERRQR